MLGYYIIIFFVHIWWLININWLFFIRRLIYISRCLEGLFLLNIILFYLLRRLNKRCLRFRWNKTDIFLRRNLFCLLILNCIWRNSFDWSIDWTLLFGKSFWIFQSIFSRINNIFLYYACSWFWWRQLMCRVFLVSLRLVHRTLNWVNGGFCFENRFWSIWLCFLWLSLDILSLILVLLNLLFSDWRLINVRSLSCCCRNIVSSSCLILYLCILIFWTLCCLIQFLYDIRRLPNFILYF